MKTRLRTAALAAVVAALAALVGCTTISPYNAQAYEYAVTLKVESLKLMDGATQPFAQHAEEVAELQTRLEIAYEHARGREKNELAARQWEILKDPNRRLLGGFLSRWESQGTMSAVFIEEAKGLVAEAFDTIVDLEYAKRQDVEIVE